MTNNFYIDSLDAYAKFGVVITNGSYNSMLAYPAAKPAASIGWPEWDGAQFDLSAPKLGTTQLTINFMADTESRFGSFVELLSDKAYHMFDFFEAGVKHRLRLTSGQKFSADESSETFELQFTCDDYPLLDYTYLPPETSKNIPDTGIELDGLDLAMYGVCVTGGSMDEILKSPAVKSNLTINVANCHGAMYDNEIVVYEPKDVKLNCFMAAASLGEFHRNYNALLFDLIRPDERSLYVDATGYEYPCFYKSCAVSRFANDDGQIWFEFSLTMTFTAFRIEGHEYLLTSEPGEWMMTEDGIYAIDLFQN